MERKIKIGKKVDYAKFSGSLIQQDFGEEITKGVLIWDIDTKESIFKPVKNDYAYINLYLNDVENLNEIYFASKSHIRLISNQDIDDIKQSNLEKIVRGYLSNKHIEVLDYIYEHVSEKSEIQVDSSVENIYDVNIQSELIREYLKKNLIKDEIIDACIKRNIELNDKIIKEDYAIANWFPEELNFSNFFSYSENNSISIGNSKGITGIFGKNESGKCVDKNTKVEIEFDKDEINKKIGFLPDELNSKQIIIYDIYNIFKKYGDLNLKVKTPYGFKKILACDITAKNSKQIEFYTETGLNLICSPEHLLKYNGKQFKKIIDLHVCDNIETINGIEQITAIKFLKDKKDLYDIQVEEVKQYYSNGIVSHNSSIFEVLYYTLFGETYRKTSTRKLINNSKENANSSVIVNINGVRYKFNRTIILKDNGQIETGVKIENLSDPSDDTLPTGKKEIKEWIKNKIGNSDDFKTTALSNQFNIQKIILDGSAERGQLLIRFIGLKIFKDLEKLHKPDYDETTRLLKTFKKDDILKNFSDLQLQITKDAVSLKEKNEEKNEIEKDIKGLNENIKSLNEQIKIINHDKITNLYQEKNNFESKIILVELNYSDLKQIEDEINKYKNKIQLNSNQIEELQKTIIDSLEYDEEVERSLRTKLQLTQDKLNSENKILNQLQSELNNLNQKIENAKKYSKIIDEQQWCRTTEVCQKCMFLKNAFEEESKINLINDQLKDIELKVTTKKYDLEKYELKKKSFDFEIDFLLDNKNKNQNNDLNKTKIENLQNSTKNYEHEIAKINLEIQKIEDNQKIIENNKIFNDNIEKLNAQIISFKYEITKLEIKIKDIENLIGEKNKEISNITNEINNLKVNLKLNGEKIVEINNRIDELTKIEKKYVIYETYFNMIHRDGLPKTILSQYINEINTKMNNILHNIVNWSAYFRIDGDNIDIIIEKPDGFSAPASENGSGMQTTLIGLAARAALLLVSRIAKCKVLFFDEPIGAFDAEKQIDVVKVFNYLKTLFPSIFVISHIEINDICNNIIQIEKETDGFTKLNKF